LMTTAFIVDDIRLTLHPSARIRYVWSIKQDRCTPCTSHFLYFSASVTVVPLLSLSSVRFRVPGDLHPHLLCQPSVSQLWGKMAALPPIIYHFKGVYIGKYPPPGGGGEYRLMYLEKK
jgi:hypothetical protein